ncbi:type I phosphomannose isomerase catalytic subunit [Oribacterium sinus]|uniref:Putative mannose-6-phosphate isomerase, class I n=1 Tax=Oribacterium sinus F0268 TaxID=585501 RepID=C2KUK2_9FIRM|nr:type I phosphomannose isomerase catalytic subunit [Oribacterium sinus]EEJ52559.1 putative mannose-6-phosphate isomerase, class I [Oribacterium sinus F0268]
MAIGKIHPACKQYLWGGEKLIREYGISSPKTPLAEAWVLSAHPDGDSRISFSEGELCSEGKESSEGESFAEYLKYHPEAVGSFGKAFPFFPTLIKLIDAKKALSIQVHPDDSFALSREGQYGKTEMWIVLEREEGAFLYFGFQKDYTEEEIRRAIEEENFPSLLCKVMVEPGDVFFIPAGTVHAIGAGILLAEVQQNSNLTYRVYDYGRKDAQGNTRELHVEKALEVMNRKQLSAYRQEAFKKQGKKPVGEKATGEKAAGESATGEKVAEKNVYLERIGSCEYFTVDRLFLEENAFYSGKLTKESFLSLLVLEGEGVLTEETKCCEDMHQESSTEYKQEKCSFAGKKEQRFVKKGESYFLPAEEGQWSLKGTGKFLLTFLSEKDCVRKD